MSLFDPAGTHVLFQDLADFSKLLAILFSVTSSRLLRNPSPSQVLENQWVHQGTWIH